MATPSSVRKTARLSRTGPAPSKHATLAQFRLWSPSRQKTWLTAMNLERSKNALNPDQLQNLTQAQVIFDRGI